MSAILQGKTLHLAGSVGDGWFDEETFNSVDILVATEAFAPEDELTVHLNSPGGIASEGAAIYAMLAARPGAVHVVIEGIAASAASLIAMAGKTVSMSPGSVMMIHDPSGFTSGNSEAHGKAIEALEVLASAYASVYARKSGKPPSACRAIMKAETWFTPEQAVKAGFADTVGQGLLSHTAAAFDYSKFKNAPPALVAMARANDWAAREASHQMKTQPAKDGPMPKDNQAHAAAAARIKAIMKADEAKGRTELAEHLAYETDMEPDAAIALMQHAPDGKHETAADDYHPRRNREARQMNASGLNGATGRDRAATSRLVDSMKQRHGAK
ncbi:peptidase S14 ClpP [Rhizobium sp. PDO1-076]|nr:peptidase S14 ClpP [Rhizobium sp. PDO1-076]